MAKKIPIGTPIKGWKNVKTGEIKTYEEWLEQLPEGTDKISIPIMIYSDELIPVY